MKRLLIALLSLFALRAVAADVPIVLDMASGAVHGSLRLPAMAAKGKVPVALLISGSGPTDRNGNVAGAGGRNDSLQMLAATLADDGYASVRYDKRGIAASAAAAGRESDLRFDTYVADAAAWITKLSTDTRFSAVIVIGHSEGSLIGMLAARDRPVQAFVSIAGTARAAPVVLREQLKGKLPPDLAQRSEAILAALEQGRTVPEVPPELAVVYRPSVQPYMISWFRHNPAAAMAALRVPSLVLQGDTDTQVTLQDARALAAANPRAELQVIAGMNHVMKPVPNDAARQMASYADPTLPLAGGLRPVLQRFLASALR